MTDADKTNTNPQTTDDGKLPTKGMAQILGSLTARGWPTIAVATGIFLLLAAATVGLAYVCWFRAIPSLFVWGFDNWEINKIGKSVLAIVAFLYLGIAPAAPFVVFPTALDFLSQVTFRQELNAARDAQKEIEDELSKSDSHQAVLVLRYSRVLLKEYYTLGMNQAQKSYRYALIAMWLGFAVLLIGVADQLGWLTIAFSDLNASREKVAGRELVLLTGTVMEFIAGLFLWVYHTSLKQLIYFYKRQYALHKTLLAERLIRGMTEKNNEASLVIIKKLIEDAEDLKVEAPRFGRFSEAVKREGKADSVPRAPVKARA